ncbi:MAG: NAD(P)/FAD-dependent oxidoreductase [Candidatus Eisenbacteria sp.]|nr:NAD(P)/FAD-dependent oxidoreductase [Candidatus Eisenbacteria bacterium]
MSEAFDVIVVGAGPAGSSCARRAGELGLSVTVLEKSTFPRFKPCGAGLTEKALRLLNGEQAPVEHRRFDTAEIAFDRYLSLLVGGPETLLATTTRAELDALLAGEAEAAGAELEFGRAVTGLEREGEGVRVRVGGDSMTACHVVVADGARGAGRRMLGLTPLKMGGGIYVRAFPGAGGLPELLGGRVLFDPTAARRGYGWIFPKGDHLNVGVFSQCELCADLRRDLDVFVARRGLGGWHREGPFAFPIPVGRPADALGTDRVLFAGDAAGLVNPVTGEGISSAILSGRLAAEAVSESLDTGRAVSASYARRIEAEVVPMTDGSRKKGDFVYGLGPGFLRLVARTPGLKAVIAPAWRAAMRDSEGFSMTVAGTPHRRRA